MSSFLLKKYNIYPKKSLWQNFLTNNDILIKIATYLELKWKNIIEVWPWYWALTEKILLQNPISLELVELDKQMIETIELRIKNWELKINGIDFNINNIDVLKYEPDLQNYIIIANIPYYITSPILFHFLYDVLNKPKEMIIMMQKDVADKIRKINWNKNSVLSLYIDFMCDEIREITKVWPDNFIPPPKVESTVLYFKTKSNVDKKIIDEFLRLIKIWFAKKRKKLSSNLSEWLNLNKDKILNIFKTLNLNENVRAEELGLEKWIELVIIFMETGLNKDNL